MVLVLPHDIRGKLPTRISCNYILIFVVFVTIIVYKYDHIIGKRQEQRKRKKLM